MGIPTPACYSWLRLNRIMGLRSAAVVGSLMLTWGLSFQPQAAPRTTGCFPQSLYLYVPQHMWRSRWEWVQVTLKWRTCDEKSECSFAAGPPCPGFHIQAWMMPYCSTGYVSGPTQLKPVLVKGSLCSVQASGFTFSLPEKERMKGQSKRFRRKIPSHGNHRNGDYSQDTA